MENIPKDAISKIKRSISGITCKDFKTYGIRGTFNYSDFIQKIKEQENKCYICLQEFQYNGKQWCYFFPSADRIYNYIPHNKENIGISCLFCNIRMFKQISEKKCGLCEGLSHVYTGDIITKSDLFRILGNNDDYIKEYINTRSVSEKKEYVNRLSVSEKEQPWVKGL
jgi:hypothetical protein